MPVQRWRLRFERGEAAAALSQRDIDGAWGVTSARFRTDNAQVPERPRVVIGAPLPIGMTAGLEVADLYLPERRRLPDVRATLESGMPVDHRLVDLHDVWLGAPALPGLVVAGDYRVAVVAAGDADDWQGQARATLTRAIRTILESRELPRLRSRGGGPGGGNLRPFILDVRAPDSAEPGSMTRDLWMRLRFHPSQGTGRPEEVVSALGSILGVPLVAGRLHRERLWLQGELTD